MSPIRAYVLGAGVTGLSAGLASGFPILEASPMPGGICRSYELPRATGARNHPDGHSQQGYRFEVGGGHWIHSRYRPVVECLQSLTPMDRYQRLSAVYFHEFDICIPYPVQEHIEHFPMHIVSKIAAERNTSRPLQGPTMRDYFEQQFGATLCGLFFHPFHERYTAGLYHRIAPQDAYKTPRVSRSTPCDGNSSLRTPGYNETFLYPRNGFSPLIDQLASLVAIEFERSVAGIDVERASIGFTRGNSVRYEALISSLPTHAMQRLTGIETRHHADPYTSVLVINIGAIRGAKCPEVHWLYVPHSESGFHRVGIYSNVSKSFLPDTKDGKTRTSLYVEMSFPGGEKPTSAEIQDHCDRAVKELRTMRYIEEVEVVDPTWIDVAYTWRLPGSTWVEEMLDKLRGYAIVQAGRYATWHGYGIADSMRDGFLQGTHLAGESYAHDSAAFRALSRLHAPM